MYEQSARDPSFAGTCARCGSKVSGQVSSCPHCGAPARYIFGERGPMKRPGAVPPGAPDGRADVPRSGRPGSSFASNDSVYPYDEVRRPAPVGAGGAAGGVSRKGVKKGAVLALLAVVALVGGAALMHWYDDTASHEPPVRSIAAQGDVTPNNAIQPAPAPSMQASQAVAPAPTTSASTSTSTSSSSGTESGDKRHRLMSLALARAHTGLEQNDLRMARSGIYWTLSLQPDNSDALGMKQDLLSRERARDAALKAARSCGQERQQCVWQNANTALSIDSSSAGAKALVESSRGAKPPGVPSVPTNGTMGTMPQ